MFTIYEEGVRSFSGTLERLYETRRVEALTAPGRDAPDAEGDEGAGGRDASGAAAEPGDGGGSPTLSQAAIAAYRNATKLGSRERIVHAHQVMRHPVVSVSANADVRDAWLLLREHGIRQVPVQTPEVELLGMLSERELLEQLIIERDRIQYGQARLVSQVMHREVVTAEPVTDVRRIARVMVDREMTAMPIVTAEDKLVGIVSRGDLLRAMTRTPPLNLWT